MRGSPGKAPVVVLGAHRSGTSLLGEILEILDVALVPPVSSDLRESVRIVELNEWLLRRAGGSWEYPAPLRAMLEPPAYRLQAVAEARHLLRRIWAGRSSTARHWGWKDPRTTFTLPIWEEALGMQVLSLVAVRGAGAVAASLHRRAWRDVNERRSPLAPFHPLTRIANLGRRRELHYYRSSRCLTPAGAVEVWREYTRAALGRLSATPSSSLLMRYEDLQRDTMTEFRRLADFLAISPSATQLSTVEKLVRKDSREGPRSEEWDAALSSPEVVELQTEIDRTRQRG